MPQAEYIIQTEHTSGNTAKHYHGVSISTLNSWASDANNIPLFAVIDSIEVYYSGKLSLGDTKFYVGFTNDSSSEPGQKIISDQLKTSQKSWQQPLPFSGRNINTSYSVLSVYMNSGIIYKKFTCYSFKVIYTYSIPTYTLTVNAGTGGTASGGGTYQAGTTATITATPNTGYTFVKWSDGNTQNPRTVSVTGNATYTAEFKQTDYQVTTESDAGANGVKATISGSGTYKYGDTITIKAEAPPNHKISAWFWQPVGHATGYVPLEFEGDSFSIVLSEDNLLHFDDDFTLILFNCSLEFTGYTVKASVDPEGCGYVERGIFMDANGTLEYSGSEAIPSEGYLIDNDNWKYFGVKAIPNKGYAFVQWSDGVKTNPREANLTGDTTFTAEFTLVTFDVRVYEGYGKVKGATMKLSGGGTYKFGDTITIKAEIPPYHKFEDWSCSFLSKTVYFEENPLVITLDERFCNGDNALVYVTFDCNVRFTGYTLKANSSPDSLNTDSNRIEWTYSDRPDRWQPIMDEGVVITRTTLLFLENVVPEIQIRARTSYNGYEFVRWSDESPQKYQNPRTINLTGDATFTAIFKKKPPEFTSASVTYLNKPVSASNKVICGEGFIISVGVT